MIRLLLRWIPLGLLISIITLLALINMSPVVPDNIGVVRAWGSNGSGNVGTVFLDLDSGLLAERLDFDIDSQDMIELPDTAFGIQTNTNPNEVMMTSYFFDVVDNQISFNLGNLSGATQIANFDNLTPVETFWKEEGETIYVIDATEERTILHILDVTSGDLNPIITIPEFRSGFMNRSPDGTKMILRQFQQNIISTPLIARPMYLIDLESETVISLGTPDFAYWSPDSQKIAMGHVTDSRFIVDVSVYTIKDDAVRDLGVQGYHPDLPVFDNSFKPASLIWAPDSSGFAINNQQAEQLTIVTLDGNLTIIEGGNLDPIHWSPNQEYIIALGSYDDRQIGAFIVDIDTETVIHFAQDVGLNQLDPRRFDSVALLWSLDSRFIVMASRTWVSVFNTQGEIVIERLSFYDDDDFLPLSRTIQWADGVSRELSSR